jgi:hypothetical protein
MISTIFAVAIALFGVIGSSHPFEKRQGNDSTWGLYAYGDHIGGLPVFFADGKYLDLFLSFISSLTFNQVELK